MQPYGPPELLIWDGESGMTSDEAKTWADRWDIEIINRPKHKKAWIAERHHEILRHGLHKSLTQLMADRIVVPFRQTLAAQVLARTVCYQ